MKKQMQKGFTLIELMVVIVIIGILAAIAIPSYLDNANRAKITEGVNLMAALKSAVSETYISLGQFPTDAHATAASSLGISSDPADYGAGVVNQIQYVPVNANEAKLEIQYDDAKLGAGVTNSTHTLTFHATGGATGVAWSCKKKGSDTAPLPDKYRPANCRGTSST